MSENITTSALVKEELENDLYLLEILKQGLVNYSALARKLLPKISKKNKKATIESIMIATKRYVAEEKQIPISETVREIIRKSQLSTKNDVTHMTLRRSEDVLSLIMDISKKIDWSNDEIFLINQGSGEVTVILDNKNKSLLKKCAKHLIEKTDDLAILSIKESFSDDIDKSINVPGVYAYFINHLSRNSINIIEIISTYSQLTFVLRSEDLMRAYSVLESRIRHFRE